MLKYLKTFRSIVEETASKQSAIKNASIQSVKVPTLVTEKKERVMMIDKQFLVEHFEQCQSFNGLIQLHSLTIKIVQSGHVFYASKLIQLYSNFATVQTVRKVFDEMSKRRISTGNLVLNVYYKEKDYQGLLVLFSRLFSLQKVDGRSVLIVLKACCELQELRFGEMIQGFVGKSAGLSQGWFIGSSLIGLYSECGRMESALCVFEEYDELDAVLWSTVVSGYVQNGEAKQALEFFARTVIGKFIVIDAISLISVVSACTRVLDVKAGKSVHGYMIRAGFNHELPLLNAVLSFYGKTGCVSAAGKLFRKMESKDLITWGCIVSCYAKHGKAGEALNLFDEFFSKRIKPNVVLILSALKACEAIDNLEAGKRIHEIVASRGLDSDIMVSTALIDMYMNCCSPEEAINVFESMPVKDVICYTSLLRGCVKNGMFHTFEVLRNMLVINICPSSYDMVNILTACSEVNVLQLTSCIHCFIVKVGLHENSYVGASLIESYAKCGSLDYSIAVFDGIKDIGVVIWNSMLAGYEFHGKGHDALELFSVMINKSSVRPNLASFVSILSACNHAGLVQEGIDTFDKMVNGYKLVPHIKHYGIVFDLLGRVGKLDKAMDIISQMPGPVGDNVWGALLGACRIYQNDTVGEIAAKKLIELDLGLTGHGIFLNLHAGDGETRNFG